MSRTPLFLKAREGHICSSIILVLINHPLFLEYLSDVAGFQKSVKAARIFLGKDCINNFHVYI